MDHLEYELSKLRELKHAQAELEADLEIQTQLVYQMLTDMGFKSKTADGHRFTIVQAERTKIDEVSLKKAIGARAFNKLATAKLDQNKVKQALAEGALDPVLLSQHSENVLNKPSIRISEIPLEEQADG